MSSYSLSRGKPAGWDLQDDIEKEEEYQRQKFKMYLRMAIETTLAVGLVAAVTSIVLATNNAYKCCEPTTVVPPSALECDSGKCGPNLSEIAYVTSSDLRAIASFSGYLKFLNGDQQQQQDYSKGQLKKKLKPEDFLYLPLKLKSVELGVHTIQSETVNERQVMNLTTDCAILTFHLRTNQTAATAAGQPMKLLSVDSIEINPSGQQSGYVEPGVVQPTAIQMDARESYVCPFKQEYAIRLMAPSGHRKRLVSVVFDLLNFEVNGDPRKLALGRLSKPSRYCFS